MLIFSMRALRWTRSMRSRPGHAEIKIRPAVRYPRIMATPKASGLSLSVGFS